jgi:hypothetical protein
LERVEEGERMDEGEKVEVKSSTRAIGYDSEGWEVQDERLWCVEVCLRLGIVA